MLTIRTILSLLLAGVLPLATASSSHKQPPTARPYTLPATGYPLHLAILVASHRYHYSSGALEYVTQTGIGNIIGDRTTGFTYAAKCHDGFHHSDTGQFYQARWIKPDEKIELLMIYSDKKKPDTCIINVTLSPKPYTLDDAKGEKDDESS